MPCGNMFYNQVTELSPHRSAVRWRPTVPSGRKKMTWWRQTLSSNTHGNQVAFLSPVPAIFVLWASASTREDPSPCDAGQTPALMTDLVPLSVSFGALRHLSGPIFAGSRQLARRKRNPGPKEAEPKGAGTEAERGLVGVLCGPPRRSSGLCRTGAPSRLLAGQSCCAAQLTVATV